MNQAHHGYVFHTRRFSLSAAVIKKTTEWKPAKTPERKTGFVGVANAGKIERMVPLDLESSDNVRAIAVASDEYVAVGLNGGARLYAWKDIVPS